MLKELLSTALMSFNIVNAQPTINKANGNEQAILQYISLVQYENGLSSPKLINQEHSTIKTYLGSSIVDALKEINVDSSFEYRKKLASLNGIKNYSGSSLENLELLKLLKEAKLIKA